MIKPLREYLSGIYSNILGWRTDKKIVVFESDDWGSIRMPSKSVYEKMLAMGVRVDNCHYNKYDSLESEDDLSALFEILKRYKDRNNNHAVLTANTIVANPVFASIKNSAFQKYYYQPFTETYKLYPNHSNSYEMIKKGIEEKVYMPQFHGREHLNISRWLRNLQNKSKETLLAFENELFGISTTISAEKRKSYLAAFDFDDLAELKNQKEIIKDGLGLFKRIFGFSSLSFIATNYIWHPEIELYLAEEGVRGIQGGNNHLIPNPGGKVKIVRHRIGEKNSLNQVYLTRNAVFEPSESPSKDWVSSCLKQINMAFKFKKPAVVSTHRVNFIGSIVEENRSNNLHRFDVLLKTILKNWPDVEFHSSSNLVSIVMCGEK